MWEAGGRKRARDQNSQLIQLILCQLDVGGWRKEKGTRLAVSSQKFFFQASTLRSEIQIDDTIHISDFSTIGVVIGIILQASRF